MEHESTTAAQDPTASRDPAFAPLSTALATADAADPPFPELPTDAANTPPSTAAEPVAAGALIQAMTALSAEMAALRRDFDTKIKFDESKERQLTMMHEELQTHREGLIFRTLRPVLMDLISLYDDLAGMAAETAGDGAATAPRVPRTVALEGIAEILRRNGVETYAADAGEAVVSSRQRTIRATATDDAARAGTVAQSLRPGFAYEGRVLRAEWIEAYRYAAPQPDATQPDSTAGGDQEHV